MLSVWRFSLVCLVWTSALILAAMITLPATSALILLRVLCKHKQQQLATVKTHKDKTNIFVPFSEEGHFCTKNQFLVLLLISFSVVHFFFSFFITRQNNKVLFFFLSV
jgi:hypothetical protein